MIVAGALVALAVTGGYALQGGGGKRRTPGPLARLSVVLGRPTDVSITASVLSSTDFEAYLEIGTSPGIYTRKTPAATVKANEPREVEVTGLAADTQYYYRLVTHSTGDAAATKGSECRFHTARKPGSAFVFDVQGDSHPEREDKMYNPELYMSNLKSVAAEHPDFYIMLGDDFSIENLLGHLSQSAVDAVYAGQRSFVGQAANSAALFLVNGNHEQAGRHWLDDTPNNPAVMAGLARTHFYPLPAPGGFYSGDKEQVKHIGLLRDYYAFTWGDALFVVIDPYWHSPIGVDDGRTGKYDPATVQEIRGGAGGKGGNNQSGGKGTNGGNVNGAGEENKEDNAQEPGQGNGLPGSGGRGRKKGQKGGGGGKGARDMWQITLGDDQYHWLEKTLTGSHAKYKFVFAHHVLGTGRGGVEVAKLYEWGGQDRRGNDVFKQMRPTWSLPIHQLFVKSGVTAFFQGHDHIYCHQELDGVVYQSTPNPADDTYTAFNSEAYQSGKQLPNSGHLRVKVAPEGVTVSYIRAFFPKDENGTQKNGMTADTYTIKPGSAQKPVK